MTIRPKRGPKWQLLLELAALTICTATFILTAFGVLTSCMGQDSEGSHDYVEYWASGQLLVGQQNPYDIHAILGLERSVGFPAHLPPLVMPNAPPALLLTYPLGFVHAKPGEWAWIVLLLGSLIGAVYLVAHSLGARDSYIKLLAFSFAPVLVCLAAGQMALLVMTGAAVFLSCHRTRPFVAGAALWLCLLKPHLFIPFGIVIAVWVLRNRQLMVMAGLASTLGVTSLLVRWLDPQCWTQYGETMKTLRIDRVNIPCVSMVLRDLAHGATFAQYMPAAIGSVWALAYFWRHRDDWDWWEHGSPLLLVSLLVPPYTWPVDQCVAIPALMYGLSVCRSRTLIAVLAVLSAIIELGPYLDRDLLHSYVYLWTAPAWLAWYLVAVRARCSDERPNAHTLRVGFTESVCK